MKRLAMIGYVCLLGPLLGCLSLTAYVDPGLQKISYAELEQPSRPTSIGVVVEFQRAGKELPSANERARSRVIRVLTNSKLFSSVHSGVVTSDKKLEVVINNTGGSTKGSGYITALTLGAIGTTTVDNYIITSTYQVVGSDPIVKEYLHAIHCTFGAKSGPKGLKAMPIGAAFDKVVEEAMLLLLYELQSQGVLGGAS